MTGRKLPLVPPYGPAAVVSAVEDTVVALLGEGRSVEKAIEVAEEAAGWLAETVEQVKRRLPLAHPIACAEGCAYCCHVKVLATAPEVLRVVAYLRETKSDGEVEAIRAMVGAIDSETRGMTAEERAEAQLACPLLTFGRCAAYEARPLACRGANSFDALACERAYLEPDDDLGIPLYKPQAQLADAVRGGLCNGSGRWGLDGRLFELTAALRVALDRPDAALAWAAGAPVFDEALDAEFDAMVRAQGSAAEPQ